MTKPYDILFAALLCLFPAFSSATAADDPCLSLTTAERQRANDILGAQYCYDCCDLTLAECLQQTPRCRLAVRLEHFICRLVESGRSCREIDKALRDRGLSMMDTPVRNGYDTETAARVGKAGSPVKVVLYICARCPFCSKLFPPLYRAVTNGVLSSKVALFVKIFPIKGHPYSVEGGLAAMAAWHQGRMAELLLRAYENFEDFKPEQLPVWAREIGLNMADYERAVKAPETRERLVEIKREGYAARVQATPTLFINNRRYQGLMDHETLVDVMLEVYERVRGDTYE